MSAKTLVCALCLVAASPLLAIQGTITTENDSKSGNIEWRARTKSYSVAYRNGKTEVTAEYPLADVVSLSIPRPAALDKLIEACERGQGASAVNALQKIVADYRMLVWDRVAGRYLVEAYLAQGNVQKASEVCTAMIADDKSAATTGELASAYWRCLSAQGQKTKLEACLKEAAASGNRAASCAALVMRGDLILAEGEGADNVRKALTDGYLRAALMYLEPECATERRSALLKAAACFDKLGHSSRAEDLRKQAKAL